MSFHIGRLKIFNSGLSPFWVLSEDYLNETYKYELWLMLVWEDNQGSQKWVKNIRFSVPLWRKRSNLTPEFIDNLEVVIKKIRREV